MMSDELQQLLLDYTGDELGPEEQTRVEGILASDDEARRFVDEHRLVWSALGQAYAEPRAAGLHADPMPDQLFRQATLSAARRAAIVTSLRAWAPRLAVAAVLLVAVILGWQRFGPTDDREAMRHLHLLDKVGFLQVYGVQLDLQSDIWIYKAFDGEVEEDV